MLLITTLKGDILWVTTLNARYLQGTRGRHQPYLRYHKTEGNWGNFVCGREASNGSRDTKRAKKDTHSPGMNSVSTWRKKTTRKTHSDILPRSRYSPIRMNRRKGGNMAKPIIPSIYVAPGEIVALKPGDPSWGARTLRFSEQSIE